MKYNIYDFDDTIYDGDSSLDFFLFSLKQKKHLIFIYLYIFIKSVFYMLIKKIKKGKESFFSFLYYFEESEKLVEDFWVVHNKKIKKFYLKSMTPNDIIISASPEFLVFGCKKYINTKYIFGTKMDIKTGEIDGENCKGEEKVRRLNKEFKHFVVDKVYSDSYSDMPIFKLGQEAFLVKDEEVLKIGNINEEIPRTNILAEYILKNKILKYILVGILTIVVTVITYWLFSEVLKLNFYLSNILSWIAAVTFSYRGNKEFVFKNNQKSFYLYFYFVLSRVLTLILDLFIMFMLVKIILVPNVLSKLIVQIVIIVVNYILSVIIFNNKKNLN